MLREGRRQGRRVVQRTLANVPHQPPERVELLRRVLNDEPLISPEKRFEIVRSSLAATSSRSLGACSGERCHRGAVPVEGTSKSAYPSIYQEDSIHLSA
ncbi:MAG TPA: hypothetical protein PLM33_12315 [Acidobacteriota bacterium]|nr:hypothetical protein [Acidobacteriota bacterium]